MSIWKRWISVLMVFCLLCSVCSCTGGSRKNKDQELISQRVEKFEDCFHTLDIYGMLDCVDPADVTGIRLGILGLQLVTGQKAEDLTDVAAEGLYYVIGEVVREEAQLPQFDTKDALEACLETVSIRPDEISFPSRRDNDEALANCVVKIDAGVDVVKSRVELKMIKSDGEWYIDLR